MNTKKVLIFDFDGTFYSGEKAFSKLHSYVNKHKRDILPRLTDSQYKQVLKENPIWKEVFVGSDIVDFIYFIKKKYPSFDISIKDFWNWQNSKPDPIVIDKNYVVDTKFLKELCEKYPVYVVSNSSPVHVYYYMKKLKINPDWFVEIISNHFIAKDKTKKHYYQAILEKENCLPQNASVFGDSIKSDLNPAEALNIKTYHVTNACDIPYFVNKALNRK